eukprot:SAG11_NODE_5040_length_1682_cov_2.234997_1_plen_109_part_10
MAELAGRPLTVLLLQIGGDPNLWRELRADIHAANARGLAVNGQVGCRPVGILLGWELSINPFLQVCVQPPTTPPPHRAATATARRSRCALVPPAAAAAAASGRNLSRHR